MVATAQVERARFGGMHHIAITNRIDQLVEFIRKHNLMAIEPQVTEKALESTPVGEQQVGQKLFRRGHGRWL